MFRHYLRLLTTLLFLVPINSYATEVNNGTGQSVNDFHIFLNDGREFIFRFDPIPLGGLYTLPTTPAGGVFSLDNGAPTPLSNGRVIVGASWSVGGSLTGGGETPMTDPTNGTFYDSETVTILNFSGPDLPNVGDTLIFGNGNTLTISRPVPEADTWAMLLAGLGLVGAATRRRCG